MCTTLFLEFSQRSLLQMKTPYLKNIWMRCTLGLSLMGALATVANAESFSVQVPFAFTAAGKAFPAGTYTVDPITSGILLIRGDTSAESGTVAASPTGYAESPAKPSLSFDRTSDLPVLSSVRMDSGKTFTLAPAKRLTAATAVPAKGTVALSHP
jgi:hypothetical protein